MLYQELAMTEDKKIIGNVHSIETFGSADGPGVRFVVFLQGCQMRCRYCHNPETWDMQGGEVFTPEGLLNQAMRYKAYWGKKGGITVSGGEALLQSEFVTEFFSLAKKEGIHTALDTSGNPFEMNETYLNKFVKLMEVTDLFILDLKHIRDEVHQKLTGCTNKNILQLASFLSKHKKPMWIRHVLVPGYTDKEEDLKALGTFIQRLDNVERVEVLPYHTLGLFKWKNLKLNYTLQKVVPPSKDEVERAKRILSIC